MISLGRVRSLGCACDGLGRVRGLGDCLMYDDTGEVCLVSGTSTNLPDSVAPGTYANGLPVWPGTTSSVPATSSGGSALGTSLTSAFASLANLFNTRLGVPQLNPGQSITVTPGGYQITQQPAGVPASGASLGLTGTSSGSLLPLLLIGGAAVLLMSKR